MITYIIQDESAKREGIINKLNQEIEDLKNNEIERLNKELESTKKENDKLIKKLEDQSDKLANLMMQSQELLQVKAELSKLKNVNC